MATLIPYINPIRIKPRSEEIDYVDTLPRFDLMTQRENYQRGVTAQNAYYPDYLFTKQIEIEVFDDVNVTVALLRNLDTGITQGCVITNITPTGWVSGRIFRISVTPSAIGRYQFEISTIGNGWYDSDIFYTKTALDNKDLIEFDYSDTENRLEYGGGFYSGDAGDWSPKAYFTGIKKPIISPREDVVFVDEPGNPITLQITSSKSEQIILTDIHHTYLSVIEEIVKVDTIYINGQLMTVTEISSEPIDDKTDLVNITMTITRADNNGFYNY